MIKVASQEHVPQIRTLIELVPGLWHAEWRADAVERALRSADGLAYVWEEEGNIVGFSCAHDVGFLGYLSVLVVAESARGRGIGEALVRHTEQELAAHGCATLIADVWQDAIGFYQKLGWSAPGVVFLRKRLVTGSEILQSFTCRT